MKKIAAIMALAGVFLAILAQYALTDDWALFPLFHTLGFIGYIFIISGLAYFSLLCIHQLTKDEKMRIKRYYQRHSETEA
ncbi:hypothetical protein [Chitinophaga vietnamensis]|uniref:hypothetical protein n=1 Tax=Chitinophaga vietnamensis TaxID=2593957 RepID=UPI00117893BF|nr:hypothetical protein [Chitinophaga vietnamensis]